MIVWNTEVCCSYMFIIHICVLAQSAFLPPVRIVLHLCGCCDRDVRYAEAASCSPKARVSEAWSPLLSCSFLLNLPRAPCLIGHLPCAPVQANQCLNPPHGGGGQALIKALQLVTQAIPLHCRPLHRRHTCNSPGPHHKGNEKGCVRPATTDGWSSGQDVKEVIDSHWTGLGIIDGSSSGLCESCSNGRDWMGEGFGKNDKVSGSRVRRLDSYRSYSVSAGVEMNRSFYGNQLTLYGTQWAQVRECVMQISGVFLARPLPWKPMSLSFAHPVYLAALVFRLLFSSFLCA